jgi:bacillithiol biosynthesis cysteine-adding enzyme BshC
LLVLQPDRATLKAAYRKVMREDLLDQVADKIVGETGKRLESRYKLQVNPRPVNLFYLRDGIRNRIDKRGNRYAVDGTVIRFSEAEILAELDSNPERFSPNVILRGLYQETILPNIIFVGGGSEVAYWMQLKDLFTHYQTPFPVLALRNSFTIMDANLAHKMNELEISDADLFKEETTLANEMVQRWSGSTINLDNEEKESRLLFAQLKKRAGDVDKTLTQHVHALEIFHLKKLESLEKKMLKAERKKQATGLQRIWKLREDLFPNDNLQERVENFMPYYARYGQDFITAILNHSLALEHKFGMLIIS